MSEKSPLEKDIERRELLRVPFSVVLLIVLLSLSLGALGFYGYKLRQELMIKKEEMVLMKRGFDARESELTGEIARLKKEKEALLFCGDSECGETEKPSGEDGPEKETQEQ